MRKVLSIVIPAYNVERYLSRCLDSVLYDDDVRNDLDVIIVNDGSKDGTLKVAKRYEEEYPAIVKVIDKRNGGHGSGINAGIKKAKGKYFRVLDADDWVNIDDFSKYVKALRKTETDIVITSYKQDLLYKEKEIEFSFEPTKDSIENVKKLVGNDDVFFLFSMHSMTVKLERLKEVWEDLYEKTFYVDNQYVVEVLECAKEYEVLPFDIYRYFIGRPEQSMSAGTFFKRRKDHERVIRWLIGKYKNTENDNLKTFMKRQISMMLRTHYELYKAQKKLTVQQKKEIRDLLSFVEDEAVELLEMIKK